MKEAVVQCINGTLIGYDEESIAELSALPDGPVYIEIATGKEGITKQQRRAVHKYLRLVALELVYNGVTLEKILDAKVLDLDPTMELLKEVVWKALCQALFNKDSSEKLSPEQVNEVYIQADNFFRKNFNVSVPFPDFRDIAT